MKILNRKLNVVIVAGASGIGREIAGAYDREKCNVFVCDISDSFIQSFKNDYPNICVKPKDQAPDITFFTFGGSVHLLFDVMEDIFVELKSKVFMRHCSCDFREIVFLFFENT